MEHARFSLQVSHSSSQRYSIEKLQVNLNFHDMSLRGQVCTDFSYPGFPISERDYIYDKVIHSSKFKVHYSSKDNQNKKGTVTNTTTDDNTQEASKTMHTIIKPLTDTHVLEANLKRKQLLHGQEQCDYTHTTQPVLGGFGKFVSPYTERITGKTLPENGQLVVQRTERGMVDSRTR
ncbi:LOW QUALITY PROTEIN: Protein of unknown function [Gryllus bimaculatus]|nr:LOW QUALITY PROTEIN: Protein of unknown function [Gryllus bimaculatus]